MRWPLYAAWTCAALAVGALAAALVLRAVDPDPAESALWLAVVAVVADPGAGRRGRDRARAPPQSRGGDRGRSRSHHGRSTRCWPRGPTPRSTGMSPGPHGPSRSTRPTGPPCSGSSRSCCCCSRTAAPRARDGARWCGSRPGPRRPVRRGPHPRRRLRRPLRRRRAARWACVGERRPASSTAVTLLALTAALVLAAVAMILRFRRSRGVERTQMKWLAAAAAAPAHRHRRGDDRRAAQRRAGAARPSSRSSRSTSASSRRSSWPCCVTGSTTLTGSSAGRSRGWR